MRIPTRIVRAAPLCLLLLLALAGGSPGQSRSSVVRIGILPAYDEGGDSFGEAFTQNLSLMVFRALEGRHGIEPVLLNPGGAYAPSSVDGITDYAQQAGVDAVLVTALEKSDAPKRGDWTIHVRGELVDLASGKHSAPWAESATVEARNAQLDYRHFGDASRRFDKQPLGQRAQAIAEAIARDLPARLTGQPSHAAAAATTSQSCPVAFKVSYRSNHAISKAYTIIVNGKDESLSISDGVTPLTLKSGAVLIQAAVQDAPSRVPRQPLYQASTVLDCSAPQHDLVLEVGSVGEALLVWK
jgi:hypothetical protein